MQLLVDLGNSALKYCTYEGETLLAPQRELYKNLPADKLFESLSLDLPITEAWISSVASENTYHQIEQRLKQLGIPVIHQLHSCTEQNGVRNAYVDASQLGVDRWMGLQAIQSYGLSSAIIVSCGTAITVDVLTENGQHQGGFISAGLGLQLQSLGATALPQFQQANIDAISSGFNLAKDTEKAVISGTLYSIVSWIDRVVEESCYKNNNNIPRVITGGDASVLLPYLSEQSLWCHKPNLVLQGVATIAGGS